jgi:hypothetical protein
MEVSKNKRKLGSGDKQDKEGNCALYKNKWEHKQRSEWGKGTGELCWRPRRQNKRGEEKDSKINGLN